MKISDATPRAPSTWKILFAVGPGDTVGSFDEWSQGESQGASASLTYTALTLNFCRESGAQGWLISSCERKDIRHSGQMIVENRPKIRASGGALAYHWQQFRYFVSLARSARAYGATHVVIDTGTTHWFWWTMVALRGTKIYANFHNTYYTIGHWRGSAMRNAIRRLDGWFFKHFCDGAVGVSDECRKQFVELGGAYDRCVVYNAIFRREDFVDFSPQQPGPELQRLLYVGRMESNKGVLDLLDAFDLLQTRHPELNVALDYCGEGPAIEDIKRRLDTSPALKARVTLHGQLKRQALLSVYRAAHVVVVPTTSRFMEGFPKVCAEAILTRRPLVISDAVPTIEGLADAAMVYRCDQPEDLMQALAALLSDPALYADKVERAGTLGDRFFNECNSMSAALAAVVR